MISFLDQGHTSRSKSQMWRCLCFLNASCLECFFFLFLDPSGKGSQQDSSFCGFVCLSVCLSVCFFVCLFVCLIVQFLRIASLMFTDPLSSNLVRCQVLSQRRSSQKIRPLRYASWRVIGHRSNFFFLLHFYAFQSILSQLRHTFFFENFVMGQNGSKG